MPLPPLPPEGSTSWYPWAAGIHSAVHSVTAGVVNVRDHGAVGDGVTDDSAAFVAALEAVTSTATHLPQSLSPDRAVCAVIHIPPGRYLLSEGGAFLGREVPAQKDVGVAWRGTGRGNTHVIFQSASAAPMCTNNTHLGLEFSDISFWAGTPDCTFMLSATNRNAQRYLFYSCEFHGWRYVLDLRGDDNNSEFGFFYCHSASLQDDGAFFHVGESDTSDQFLNYWFFGCTHWSTSAPFVDAAKGGHFHIFGLDASDWGRSLASPDSLFRLRGTTHARGVTTFNANGVRVEAKSRHAGLLESEWPSGNVTFRNVDWSSQADFYRYGDIVRIKYANTDGANYAFYDSTLAGGVRVSFGTNDWQHSHAVSFMNCNWLQRASPTDVVTYDANGNDNPLAVPPVDFIRCRGELLVDPLSPDGAAVWEARVGYRGQPLQVLEPRLLSIRGLHGLTSVDDGPVTVVLPRGAIVTALHLVAPAGANSQLVTGSWDLVTSEDPPATVARLSVSRDAAAGLNAWVDVTPPFLCDSPPRAKLRITATGVGSPTESSLLLIKGYW